MVITVHRPMCGLDVACAVFPAHWPVCRPLNFHVHSPSHCPAQVHGRGYIMRFPPFQYFLLGGDSWRRTMGLWCDATQALGLLSITGTEVGPGPIQKRLLVIKCRSRLKNSTSDLASHWECICRRWSQGPAVPSPVPCNVRLKDPLKFAPNPITPIANKQGPGGSQPGSSHTWEMLQVPLNV